MIKAKKSLGQNFLINKGVAGAILDIINPEKGDLILEIGPGRGALTAPLLKKEPRLALLLEKDRELARLHKGQPNCVVLNTDALAFPWAKLGALGVWKLLGNLPYNIASPLMWDVVSQCDGYSLAAFMVQKEVAQRATAAPGSKAYGALSVWLQSWSKPRLELVAKPGSFRPSPKVDSAVLSFLPLPQERRCAHPRELKLLLDACFRQRRKQLGGVFSRGGLNEMRGALELFSIPETARAEELTPGQFNSLAACLAGIQRQGK